MKNNLLLIAATASVILIGSSQASLAVRNIQTTFKASKMIGQNLGFLAQHTNKRSLSSVSQEATKIVLPTHKIEQSRMSQGTQENIKNEIDQITLRLLQDKEKSIHARRALAVGLTVAAVNTTADVVGMFGVVAVGGIVIGGAIVSYDIYTSSGKPTKGKKGDHCPVN